MYFSSVLVVGVLCVGPLVLPGHAQSSQDLLGSARASALGHGTTALSSTVGVHANPAAGAAHRTRTVGLYAREGFHLPEFRYGAIHGTWPTRWGVFSTGASTFGEDTYRETHLSLGYARRLPLSTTRDAYAGGLVRYYHTLIEGYGNAGALGVHLGLLLPLLPSLQFGAHATNINRPSLVDDEPLPQTLAVGLSYEATSNLHFVLDVFKDIDFPASLRGGIEVHPLSLLALRAGMTTVPTRFTGGIGLLLGHIQAHVAAEQHRVLGWSPSVSVAVTW